MTMRRTANGRIVTIGVDDFATRLAGSRIVTAPAIPNPRCLTPDGMAAREYAHRTDKTVSIHVLETSTDEDMCRLHAGRSAVEYLDVGGFLWDQTLAVHCVDLEADARVVFTDRGVAVSYNPLSNSRLGSGAAPVLEMLGAGIDVGLGVDGAASNDTQEMLLALRMGSYLQRVSRKRADILDFDTMMRLATTVSPRVVDTVWVDGKPVVRDGVSTRVDTGSLTRRLSAMRP